MKIVLISNFFNHHQKEVSDELFRLTDGGYRFFATGKMSQMRKDLGWGIGFPDYVVEVGAALDEERQREVDEADVVILGGRPYAFVQNRIKQGKITFLYTERLFKKKVDLLRRIKALFVYRSRWKKKNTYLLCAGGFVSADIQGNGCFRKKAYRWGYFPVFQSFGDGKGLWEKKQKNSLLWCARLIDWKHPEAAIEVAKRLRDDGYDFSLRMLGSGELDSALQDKIEQENLQDYVRLTGSLTFEKVREEMKNSQIFLFTSDREEGWGAVLNESMNAGMAVVSSHAIGATPVLIQDGENGLVYESGNVDELYEKLKCLLDDPAYAKELGEKAYLTIEKQWNGKEAARRLLCLIERLQAGKDTPFAEGPCSKAPLVRDGWYKEQRRKG